MSMELPPAITSLSDTTYLVKLADGGELALDLLLFSQYKDLIASLTDLTGRIARKESGRETIEILVDRELYFLKSQQEELQRAIESFRLKCLGILEMFGESNLQTASPLFGAAMTNFLNGNLFETILTLDDPQIEEEARQSEEHRMRTVSYYRLKALACLLVPEIKKAGVYFEKMILIHPCMETYHWYGQMLTDTRQEARALLMEQEALKIALTDMQQAMLWERIGALYAALHSLPQATHAYEQSLMRYASNTSENPADSLEKQACLRRQAAILEHLGDGVRSQGRRIDAATAYNHALTVYTQLSRNNPGGYVGAIASLQYRLGVLANATSFANDVAESYFQLARKSQQQLTGPTDRAAYAQTLRALGSLYAKVRQPTKAAALLVQSFEIYTLLARANPKLYVPLLLDVLKLLDSQYLSLNQPQAGQTVRTYATRISRFLTIISLASLVRRKTPAEAPSPGTQTSGPTLPFLAPLLKFFKRSR